MKTARNIARHALLNLASVVPALAFYGWAANTLLHSFGWPALVFIPGLVALLYFALYTLLTGSMIRVAVLSSMDRELRVELVEALLAGELKTEAKQLDATKQKRDTPASKKVYSGGWQ
jgi:hypothetical protein